PSTVPPTATVTAKPTVTASSTVAKASTVSPTPTVATESATLTPSTIPLPLNTPPSATSFVSRTGLRLSSIHLPPTVPPQPTVTAKPTVTAPPTGTVVSTVPTTPTVTTRSPVPPTPTVAAPSMVAKASTVPPTPTVVPESATFTPSTIPLPLNTPPSATSFVSLTGLRLSSIHLPPTVASQPIVPPPPTVFTKPGVASGATAPPPRTVTAQPTAAAAATVSAPSTVSTKPTMASGSTVPSTTPPPNPLPSSTQSPPIGPPPPPSVITEPTLASAATVPPQPTVTTKPAIASGATVPLQPTVARKPTVATKPIVALGATVPSPPTVPHPPTVTTVPSTTPSAKPLASFSLPPPIFHPPTMTTRPTVASRATVPPPTVPTPSTVPPPPTVSPQLTVPPPTVTAQAYGPAPPPTVPTQPTAASGATVPSTTPSAGPPLPTQSPPIPRPASPPPMKVNDRLELMRRMDPGKDVACMAMGGKYRVLLAKLNNDPKLAPTIFNCIRNALLSLMMDERGSEVVKWFISNGSLKQRQEIVRKVEATMDDLVANGGYGRAVVQFAIDNCADEEKKKGLSEKMAIAMVASRDSASPTTSSGSEIEVVSQKINKQSAEKIAVTKVPSAKEERKRQILVVENGEVSIVPGRVVSDEKLKAIRKTFNEIDDAMIRGVLTPRDRKMFVQRGKVTHGWSQFFVDQIQERLPHSVRWLRWMTFLAEDKYLRPLLVAPVASVLHLLVFPSPLLTQMLSKSTRQAFVAGCLEGDVCPPPLARLFQPDLQTAHCVNIGMLIVKAALPLKAHAFLLSPLGRSIAESEKGREFFETVAKPPPEGCGWASLLKEAGLIIPRTDMMVSHPLLGNKTGESSRQKKSASEEQAIARPTVIPPREDTVASTSRSNNVAFPPGNTDETWDEVSRSIHQYIKNAAAAPSIFSAQPGKNQFKSNRETVSTEDSIRQKEARAVAAKTTAPRERTVASTSKTTTARSPSIFTVQPSKIQFERNSQQVINKSTVSYPQLTPAATPAEAGATRRATSSSSFIQPAYSQFGSNSSSGPPPTSMPSSDTRPFQSPLINVSPSGTPSFPILRLSSQKFSFAAEKEAVKDTVDSIVSNVANENQ
ncbi:hypothetical protein PRIPAC_94125, partial [Pristionchus pacificus]